MKKNKVISVITIICLASVVLIPIGLALMWLYTDWKKKIKAILSALLGLFYVSAVVFLLLFEPSEPKQNSVTVLSPANEYNLNLNTKGQNPEPLLKEENQLSKKKGKSKKDSENSERLPSTLKKSEQGTSKRLIYSILFFLFMLFLVIWQNLKKSKKPEYENPYVDVKKYKLPLNENSKIPMVHYVRIRLNKDEKIFYASETTQKGNEGDFIITNQRAVMLNKEGLSEFPLPYLTAVVSVTDTVMQLTSGERKYYVFLPESQMKYALAVLRWSYKYTCNQNAGDKNEK